MLTKQQLEEIRAREEKVTKGPWHAQGREIWQSFFPTKDYRRSVGLCWRHPEAQAHLDANFIAAAREDIPALLADNDALREEVERLKAAVRFGLSFASTVSDWMDEVEVNGEMMGVCEVKKRLEDSISALDAAEAEEK